MNNQLVTFFLCTVSFLLVVNCSGVEKKAEAKKQWVDSIQKFDYTKTTEAQRLESFIVNGLEIDTNSTVLALAALTNRSDFYKILGLEYLLGLDKTLFVKSMYHSGERLIEEDWRSLAAKLRICGINQNDTAVLNAVVAAILKSKPENVHSSVISFIAQYNDLKTAKSFAKLLNKNYDADGKRFFLDCMTKFKEQSLDSIAKEFLVPKNSNDTIVSSMIEYSLKWYNRYDFLPELATFRKNLVSGKIKTQEKDLLKTLDETIAELERKKYAKDPIGKPLDWPKNAN